MLSLRDGEAKIYTQKQDSKEGLSRGMTSMLCLVESTEDNMLRYIPTLLSDHLLTNTLVDYAANGGTCKLPQYATTRVTHA